MDEKSSSLTSASADILNWYYDVDRDRESVLEVEIYRVGEHHSNRGCGGECGDRTYRGI
jgi:hypothetical protein